MKGFPIRGRINARRRSVTTQGFIINNNNNNNQDIQFAGRKNNLYESLSHMT